MMKKMQKKKRKQTQANGVWPPTIGIQDMVGDPSASSTTSSLFASGRLMSHVDYASTVSPMPVRNQPMQWQRKCKKWLSEAEKHDSHGELHIPLGHFVPRLQTIASQQQYSSRLNETLNDLSTGNHADSKSWTYEQAPSIPRASEYHQASNQQNYSYRKNESSEKLFTSNSAHPESWTDEQVSSVPRASEYHQASKEQNCSYRKNESSENLSIGNRAHPKTWTNEQAPSIARASEYNEASKQQNYPRRNKTSEELSSGNRTNFSPLAMAVRTICKCENRIRTMIQNAETVMGGRIFGFHDVILRAYQGRQEIQKYEEQARGLFFVFCLSQFVRFEANGRLSICEEESLVFGRFVEEHLAKSYSSWEQWMIELRTIERKKRESLSPSHERRLQTLKAFIHAMFFEAARVCDRQSGWHQCVLQRGKSRCLKLTIEEVLWTPPPHSVVTTVVMIATTKQLDHPTFTSASHGVGTIHFVSITSRNKMQGLNPCTIVWRVLASTGE